MALAARRKRARDLAVEELPDSRDQWPDRFLEWRRGAVGELQDRLRRRNGRLLISGEHQAADIARP